MPKPHSPRSTLVSAIENSRLPVYLLDARHRLRFANEALQNLVGPSAAELEDLVLGQEGETRSELLAAWSRALLPPPHALSRPGLRFPLTIPQLAGNPSLPAVSESLQRGESIESQDMWEGEAIDFPQIEESERLWLVVLSKKLPSTRPDVPTRLIELHEAWERGRRRDVDCAADLLSGDSAAAVRLRERAMLAHRTAVRVAISGPPGSGHELLAHWIHAHRPASVRGPLQTLDCTLLDAELIQTTYRDLVRDSRAEDRPAGCLVLSGIDRLVETGQQELVNLLRFPYVPFTTIVTSVKPLAELVAAGKLDAELAMRLDVLSIDIPSLSDQLDDLPLLAHATLQRAAVAVRSEVSGWTDEALGQLQRHPWTNNYLELRELAARLVSEVIGPWVRPIDLPRHFGLPLDDRNQSVFRLDPFDIEKFLREVELDLVQLALQQCGGNKTKAARLLGLSRGGLHRRLDVLTSIQDVPSDEPRSPRESPTRRAQRLADLDEAVLFEASPSFEEAVDDLLDESLDDEL